ncbi:MAG: cation-transporting P-type ATPase [bacterium]|nr:cation-transporting P-type ATPase [bacterium]
MHHTNPGETNYYNQPAEAVLGSLRTNSQGLSHDEVLRRLKLYGPNQVKPKRQSLLKRLLEPFASLFVGFLLVAIAISLVNDERADAVIIGVVLVVNACIYYFQQISANRVLDSLRRHDESEAAVMRDGKLESVDSTMLVPGDIVILKEGVRIPADGRLLKSEALHVNESVLTGESLPVHKESAPIDGIKELFDQKNMVFKGSFVISGGGAVIITATGNKTQLGGIGLLASQEGLERSPIEAKIDHLTKKIALAVGVVGLGVFALAAARGIELSEALRFSLALVVSLVPEGLPVALTIVLLLAAKKMAKSKALVRKIASIETLGAVTLVAVDKTGTLTKNELSVADSYTAANNEDSFAKSAAASLNRHQGGDSLDEILHRHYGGKIPDGWKKLKDYPFVAQLRASGTVWQTADNQYMLFIKGAPEAIFKSSKNGTHSGQDAIDSYSKKGYRVIAFAHKEVSKVPEKLEINLLSELEFDGLVGLADEVRPGIDRVIARAQAAGIKVIMLTGDHMETAREIGRRIGLVRSNSQVADGETLASVTPRQAQELLSRITVFSRVLPKHKFDFLRALKNRQITAMTGDGVNDVPALVEADVGLAMGSGTDVAKDASEVVLIDDNFKTIISAIRLGRSVIANIQKMLFYVISTSIGEAATMIGALLMGLALPVSAAQILWINLVTDGFSVLPLGLGQPETHQMNHKPNDPKAPLLNRIYISRSLIIGLAMAVAALSIFYLLLPKGYAYAQTGAFISLVVAQWANALNANFERHSWVRNFTKPNWYLWGGIALATVFQIAVFWGPLAGFFDLVSISYRDLWLVIFASVLPILLLGDLHKIFVRHSSAQ